MNALEVNEFRAIETITMCSGDDNSFVNQGVVGNNSIESLMQNENMEFSDIDEPLMMTRARSTRSQSRVSEPVVVEKKERKGRVKRGGSVKKVRGRKPIVREEEAAITSDEIEDD